MTHDFLSQFKEHLLSKKNLSASTVSSYLNDISRFCACFDCCDAAQLTAGQIEDYFVALRQSGRSEATISRFISALKAYIRFLNSLEMECHAFNGVLKTPFRRQSSKLPKILSLTEVNLLLSLPDQDCPRGMRDKAMLELLYAAGLRINQLVSMNISDVNPTLGFVYSSALNETFKLYPTSQKALNRYIGEGRPMLVRSAGQPALFLNQKGERLSRQGFWKVLKSYQERAGISEEISPQTLRHSVAVHLLQNGADTSYIQQLLGLSSAASAKVYTKIARSLIRSDYGKYHPKAKI